MSYSGSKSLKSIFGANGLGDYPQSQAGLQQTPKQVRPMLSTLQIHNCPASCRGKGDPKSLVLSFRFGHMQWQFSLMIFEGNIGPHRSQLQKQGCQ